MASRKPFSKWSVIVILAALGISGWGLIASGGPDAAADDGTARPVERAARQTPKNAAASAASVQTGPAAPLGLRLDRLMEARTSLAPVADLFDAASLKPPPPPPPRRTRPTAPPFPYTYIGSVDDGSGRAVFLTDAERVLVVKADQTIGGVYHVDQIDSSHLTVTYLPLKEKQTISIGASQ